MTTALATRCFVLSVIRAALMGAVCVSAVDVVTAQNTATVPRVRSNSARIVDAIALGVERSATFRGLVDTIDATDGLVFVADTAHGIHFVTLFGKHFSCSVQFNDAFA